MNVTNLFVYKYENKWIYDHKGSKEIIFFKTIKIINNLLKSHSIKDSKFQLTFCDKEILDADLILLRTRDKSDNEVFYEYGSEKDVVLVTNSILTFTKTYPSKIYIKAEEAPDFIPPYLKEKSEKTCWKGESISDNEYEEIKEVFKSINNLK